VTGKFISFEGTEGVGKSTQVDKLVSHLQERGFKVRKLREPGGTPLGEKLRHLLKHDEECKGMDPVAELLLLSASRCQLIQEVIKPALAAGEFVVCDRFYDSTIAYQAYGRNMGEAVVWKAIEVSCGATRPDVTFLLKASKEEVARRLNARQPALFDRFEAESLEFFNGVEAGFAAVATSFPERVKVINSERPVDMIALDINTIIEEMINPTS
jgi:dTMP kinase